MATDYRHAGCKTPIIRWLENEPPRNDGVALLHGRILPAAEKAVAESRCPDCGGWLGLLTVRLERVPA